MEFCLRDIVGDFFMKIFAFLRLRPAQHGEQKQIKYYTRLRSEIFPFLPEKIDTLLDVGCGAGETSGYLKEIGQVNWACGIEPVTNIAEKAQQRLDQVIVADIEKMDLPFPSNHFDVIFVLDILEHLVDPWKAVEKLQKHLKPGGYMVASIPNVRNYSVMIPLLFKGEWEYRESDILDSTHLRFFTKKSAMKLMTPSGLKLIQLGNTGCRPWSPTGIVNFFSFGLLRGFFEFQYLIKVQKIENK